MKKVTPNKTETITLSEIPDGSLLAYCTNEDVAVLTLLTQRTRSDDPTRTSKPVGSLWGFLYEKDRAAGAKFVRRSWRESAVMANGNARQLYLLDSIEEIKDLPPDRTNE